MKRRPTYRSAMWHPRHMAILVAGFLALTVFPLPQAAAQESIEAAATGALGKGWSSFYDSQPFSAAEAVDKLARSSNLGTKLHALHVKARSLWLAGDPASQRAAQSLWTELAREGQGDPYSRARTEIARGLGFEKSGQAAQAIESIEQITKQNLPSCVAVEAAIELALLYAHADRVRDATAQLDEADTILGYPESIALPGELQKAFAKGVKHARESIASKGHALFLLARGMQREKQYPRAIELFNQVSQDFPASDYAPRSQCEVGACLVSMGRQDEAIEHWRAFIAAAPAGPWRGQAFLRLIDIQLAERLDLAEAERYALQAKTALAAALGQNLGVNTGGWSEAAYGLALRIGMIAFCGEDYAASCEALEQARVAAPDKAAADRLVSLIEVAREKRGIIPEECRRATSDPRSTAATRQATDGDRVHLALNLGMIHHLAGLDDLATRLFDRVTGTPAVPATKGSPARPAVQPLPGATPAQLAFAAFGKGAVLQAARKTQPARDAFLASLKAAKDGSWHDETLFRVATIIEAEADSQVAKGGEAGRDQVAAARTARAGALPFWRELVERFPESPRRELAMYRVGVLTYESAEAASAAAGSKADASGIAEARKRVEKAWGDAAKALGAFTEAYPESEYAGDAYVRQIDLSFERLFDLERAGTLGPLAATWAKAGPYVAAPQQSPPWAVAPRASSDSIFPTMRRECLIRAALTAYLREQYDEAVEYVTAAGPEAPAAGFTQAPDFRAIGVHYLLSNIQSRKQVVDPRAIEAAVNDQQRMALQLGGLYLESIRPERAEAVFLRFVEKEPALGRVPAELEAYAMLKIAVAIDRQLSRRGDAFEWLEKLIARRDLAGSHWHANAMFRRALYTSNQAPNYALAMARYQQMLDRYPDHELAELARAYYALDAITLKDLDAATTGLETLLEKFPATRHRPGIERRLQELQAELESDTEAKD